MCMAKWNWKESLYVKIEYTRILKEFYARESSYLHFSLCYPLDMVRMATDHLFFVTYIPGLKFWLTIKVALQLNFIHYFIRNTKLAASSNRPKLLYFCPFFPDDWDIDSHRNIVFLGCCVLIKTWIKSISVYTFRVDTKLYRSTTSSGHLFRPSSSTTTTTNGNLCGSEGVNLSIYFHYIYI